VHVDMDMDGRKITDRFLSFDVHYVFFGIVDTINTIFLQ